MADDNIDFLEGNAPDMTKAPVAPRPRSPMTPVPSPRKLSAAEPSTRSAPDPHELTPARPPRDNALADLEREMRLEEDPLENITIPQEATRNVMNVLESEVIVTPAMSEGDPEPIVSLSPRPEHEPLLDAEAAILPVYRTPVVDDDPHVPATVSEHSRVRAVRLNPEGSTEVPMGDVQPMQIPKSAEPRRVEMPTLTVDRSMLPASELDMQGGEAEDIDDVTDPDYSEPPEVVAADGGGLEGTPKKRFRLPAWAVVVCVLSAAGLGFYFALPYLVGSGGQEEAQPSEIEQIVAAAKINEQADGGDSDGAAPALVTDEVSSATEMSADFDDANNDISNQVASVNSEEVAPPPQALPVASSSNMSTVRLDRYSLATAMPYQPNAVQSGAVTQLGVFNDGGREIYVAKIMYPPSDLPGLSKFTALVQELAEAAMAASSGSGGTATLNGPSTLNNPRVPASIYSVAEARTDASGMEVREIKTYLAVDAEDGCLLFAVQTPDSDTGYGLTLFIEIAQQLE